MATNQRPTGGYLAVSMPTNFIQQPLQLIQPIQGTSMIYQPGEAHNLGSNYTSSSQRNTGGPMAENRSGMMGGNHMPGMSSHGNAHNFPDLKSPEQQNSMSSSSMEGPSRVRGHEKNSTIDLGPGKKAFNFQRPSSRTGSRATSVKAEPGSALESNIESNASVSASVRAVKLASPGGEGFLATSSRTSGGLHEQAIESTDSSMCSLLKSSDDFTPTTSNGSDDDEKEYALNRPTLPDPFWLANVNYSNQLVLNYQMKPKSMVEILKRDRDALKTMTQPNQVREQLAQLYRELDDTGEAIRPLLEADGSTASCASTTSSSSNGDENDEILIRNQKQKQVKFERYAIIYGEDAPMPPALIPQSQKESKSSTNSATSSSEGDKKITQSSKTSITDFSSSSSASSSLLSSKVGSKGHVTSTSLGSSSAITIEGDSRTSPCDDEETIKASDVESSKCDEGIHSKSTSNPEDDTSTKVSSEDMIPMDVDSSNKGDTSSKEAEAKADDVDKTKIKE